VACKLIIVLILYLILGTAGCFIGHSWLFCWALLVVLLGTAGCFIGHCWLFYWALLVVFVGSQLSLWPAELIHTNPMYGAVKVKFMCMPSGGMERCRYSSPYS
jgi:hypothetical protein